MTAKSIFFTCFVFLALLTFSQVRNKYKYELLGGIGTTGFLGDLGGGVGNGTHFVKDYNFNSTRFNINGGVRYKNNSPFAFKGMLTYAMVSGDDALTQDVLRHNRNLNFRSPIIELSAQVEYYFINEKTKNIYSIAGLKSKKKKRKFAPYIFAGIGAFYYNPKEELDGKWYSVRKNHTEGQGLPGGPKQFSNFNMAIPMGLGFRYAVDKRWSIGAEFGIRKTFTDYIDGVSGKYYDNAKIAQAYGTTAAKLADPNLETIPGATNAGQERGNPKYKDSYMFLTINVGYKFTKQHRTRAKF